jgi:catechol 2,3-dioxygenase-like lactoylglutathione lyase family enzyme
LYFKRLGGFKRQDGNGSGRLAARGDRRALRGVPVADLVVATGWYGQVLGRPPDVPVNEEEVMWRITDRAWLYLVVDPRRAGQALVAMSVANLDEATAALEGRGINVTSIETIPGAGRKAYFVDPDGNSIAIIEVIEA